MGKHIFINNNTNQKNEGFKRISKEEIEEKRISSYSPLNINDWQLYELYCSIPLATVSNRGRIYPKYVKIIGRSFAGPHPHRYFTFEEFLDCLTKNKDFKDVILQ